MPRSFPPSRAAERRCRPRGKLRPKAEKQFLKTLAPGDWAVTAAEDARLSHVSRPRKKDAIFIAPSGQGSFRAAEIVRPAAPRPPPYSPSSFFTSSSPFRKPSFPVGAAARELLNLVRLEIRAADSQRNRRSRVFPQLDRHRVVRQDRKIDRLAFQRLQHRRDDLRIEISDRRILSFRSPRCEHSSIASTCR